MILNYNKAKSKVQKAGIRTSAEYKKLARENKLPNGLPKSPEWVYGTGVNAKRKGRYPSYKIAKNIVQKLKIKSSSEYFTLARSNKLPKQLPKYPANVWKDWKGFNDYLNINNFNKRGYSRDGIKFWSYQKAKKFAQKNNIQSENDWQKKSKTSNFPKQLPYDPADCYKEWEGWMKFVDKNNRNGNYLTFNEARKWARKQNIKGERQWRKKHPKNIPCHAEKYYKKEWNGFNDFLGNDKGKHKSKNFKWISYEEAKKLVQQANISTVKEFRKWQKTCGYNIPAAPEAVYGGSLS